MHLQQVTDSVRHSHKSQMATSLQQTSSSLPMFGHGHTRDTAKDSSLMRDSNSNSAPLQPDNGDDDLFDPFNNPWNLISADTSEATTKLFDYVFILFVVVGVPGNIINCLVFYRQVCTACRPHSLMLSLFLDSSAMLISCLYFNNYY